MTKNVAIDIAIIGQSCLVPGAKTPSAFWENILAGSSHITPPPPGRWGIDHQKITSKIPAKDRTYCPYGGYVTGFEDLFSGTDFQLPAELLQQLDPVVLWSLYCAQNALLDAGLGANLPSSAGAGCGLFMGNLSYPTRGMNYWCQQAVLQEIFPKYRSIATNTTPNISDFFMSGLPAELVAKALGIKGNALALDAACASGIYAIELGCRALARGDLDLCLTGAVNHSDNLFINMGFCTLGAMSKSGLSRPFDQRADGLIPGEGAGFIVLRRLEDAVANKENILGVIKAVGTANDGRASNLLAPHKSGQLRCLHDTYKRFNIDPYSIGHLECHATSTPLGDKTEIEAISSLWDNGPKPVLGTIKASIGHLVTTAGIAGTIKSVLALQNKTLPPGPSCGQPIFDPEQTGLRVLDQAEEWQPNGNTPRRAAVSAFGFGGNNSHIVIEEWQAERKFHPVARVRATAHATKLAIVGMTTMVATGHDNCDFAAQLFATLPPAQPGQRQQIPLKIRDLRFPPAAFKEALAQQTLLFECARKAITDYASTGKAPSNTGVLVGMACDSDTTRYGIRWRLPELTAQWNQEYQLGLGPKELQEWTSTLQDQVIPALTPESVVGRMPNILANRISSYFDFQGPGYTIAAEEVSGLLALAEAGNLLAEKRVTAVVVAGVDIAANNLSRAALIAAGHMDKETTLDDTAVTLVVKRLEDAKRDQNRIYAVIDKIDAVDGKAKFTVSKAKGQKEPEKIRYNASPWVETAKLGTKHTDILDPYARLGRTHTASSLLTVASAAMAIYNRTIPAVVAGTGAATPWIIPATGRKERKVEIICQNKEHNRVGVRLVSGPQEPTPLFMAKRKLLFAIAAANKAELTTKLAALASKAQALGAKASYSNLLQLAADTSSAFEAAECNLTITCRSQSVLTERVLAAQKLLAAGKTLGQAPGLHFTAGSSSSKGQIAFVYTGAVAAYQHAGADLLTAFPALHSDLNDPYTEAVNTSPKNWLYSSSNAEPSFIEELWAARFVSLVHTKLLRNLLGVNPDAAIGYSSGESNALFNLDIWKSPELMYQRITDSDLFTSELVGPKSAIVRAWKAAGLPNADQASWESWALATNAQTVETAISAEQFCHLIIIESPERVVIGGECRACERVIKQLAIPAIKLKYDIAAHCPEVHTVKDEYLAMHTLPTTEQDKIRFYTNGTGAAYYPTTAKAATSLYGQLANQINFPKTINQAYRDGVRIFIELGPHNNCTKAINETLQGQDFLALPCDIRGQDGYDVLIDTLAQLAARGVAVDLTQIYHATPTPYANAKEVIPIATANQNQEYAQPPIQEQGQAMSRPPVLLSVLQATSLAKPRAAVATTTVLSVPLECAPTPTAIPMSAPIVAPAGPAPTAGPVTTSGNLSPEYYNFLAVSQTEAYNTHTQTVAFLNMAQQEFQSAMEENGHQLASLLRQAAIGTSPATVAGPVVAAQVAPIPAAVTPVPPVAAQPAATAPVPIAALTPALTVPAEAKKVLFTREDLVYMSQGKLSEKLGPLFKSQDDYKLQVRMPTPPLLLCDRVIKITGEPGQLTAAEIVTETTIEHDSWYLHHGRMPAGIMIEAGQADLLLVSYLGVDFLNNKGERSYRLLGCDLTYENALPKVGDILRYTIKIHSFARQGNVLLFYFEYDCCIDGTPVLSVRNAAAGFFTLDELNESKGVVWSPEQIKRAPDAITKMPEPLSQKTALSKAELTAFSEGDVSGAFGPEFRAADIHTRTPTIAGGKMLLIDEIETINATGGPLGLGYMRTTYEVNASDWFFDGHFHNDPCMPGTLMFQVCQQNLEVFLTYMGGTVERDGFRFEPIKGVSDRLRCRGQVIPGSKQMVYETYITDYGTDPHPWVKAEMIVYIDGLACLHCADIGIEMVRDWPLYSMLDGKPFFEDRRESIFDYYSLLACAVGRPSEALGTPWLPKEEQVIPRLPSPPYHFMSRVTSVIDCPIAVMKVGGKIEIEYDVPPDAWYFDDNPSRTMPYAVLLEVALQPCGWLASYIGSYLPSKDQLAFRNLDGDGTIYEEITPDSGIITTKVVVTKIAKVSGMIIQGFDVEVWCGGKLVYDLVTVFGFFPLQALLTQVGIAFTPEEIGHLEDSSDFAEVDLTSYPEQYFTGSLALPRGKLLMLGKICSYWEDGGKYDKGYMVTRKLVNHRDWYFTAHFFQDPVQPGSLGIEAMLQLMQFYLIDNDFAAGLQNPVLESVGLGKKHLWKYRGQVTPFKEYVTVDMHIKEVNREQRFIVADCNLWVDGLKIYTAEDFMVSVKEGDLKLLAGSHPEKKNTEKLSAPAKDTNKPMPGSLVGQVIASEHNKITTEISFDPEQLSWLKDHKPTYLISSLPFTYMVEMVAAAASQLCPDLLVGTIVDAQAVSWMSFTAGVEQIRVQASIVSGEGSEKLVSVSLLTFKKRKRAELSRFEPFFTGVVSMRASHPVFAGEQFNIQNYVRCDIPGSDAYEKGQMFHGESLQILQQVTHSGPKSILYLLDNCYDSSHPRGILSPTLLDGVHHAIPSDNMDSWDERKLRNCYTLPFAVENMQIFGPPPQAKSLCCRMRYDGLKDNNAHQPSCLIEILYDEKPDSRPWVSMRFVYICLPFGRLGGAPVAQRKAFIIDRAEGTGLSLSVLEGNKCQLELSEVKSQDWLAGSLSALYLTPTEKAEYETLLIQSPQESISFLTRSIAVKELVSPHMKLHPSQIVVWNDPEQGVLLAADIKTPYNRYRVLDLTTDPNNKIVLELESNKPLLDTSMVRPFWNRELESDAQFLAEMFLGLMQTFVQKIYYQDYPAIAALKGKSVLFLANHQVGIESLLFSLHMSATNDSMIVSLNKQENRSGWFGKIIDFCFSYPGLTNPEMMVYFDRQNPSQLLNILDNLKKSLKQRSRSLLVHVEGTRMQKSGQELKKISSVWVDFALSENMTIIPVSFRGGLPSTDSGRKLEFPVGLGRQDYYIGTPITPADLLKLPYLERVSLIRDTINTLGPGKAERPNPPNKNLAERIKRWSSFTGAYEHMATILQAMASASSSNPKEDLAANVRIKHVKNLYSAIVQATLMATNTKRKVAFVLPKTKDAGWIKKFLSMSFGPNGPTICDKIPDEEDYDFIVVSGKE